MEEATLSTDAHTLSTNVCADEPLLNAESFEYGEVEIPEYVHSSLLRIRRHKGL
jgi:hypothetical protein